LERPSPSSTPGQLRARKKKPKICICHRDTSEEARLLNGGRKSRKYKKWVSLELSNRRIKDLKTKKKGGEQMNQLRRSGGDGGVAKPGVVDWPREK